MTGSGWGGPTWRRFSWSSFTPKCHGPSCCCDWCRRPPGGHRTALAAWQPPRGGARIPAAPENILGPRPGRRFLPGGVMRSVLLRRTLETARRPVVALPSVFLLFASAGAAAFGDFQDLPRTLWTDYRRFTLAALVVFVLQLALIGALWVSRRRSARAELALRRSEARNTAILSAMPDLMFVLSSDGVYLDYHARDVRDLFVPPEQFLGKHVREVFPPDLARMFERHVRQAARSTLPVVVEYTIPILDAERHFEARLVRCDNDTVMSVVRDVTSRYQAEEELHKAHTELAQAARLRALGAMAAGIAHEVSQPISAVLLNGPSSCNLAAPPPRDLVALRDAVSDILSDGQRARDVITRIRGLVKQSPLRTAPVSMNDVVAD